MPKILNPTLLPDAFTKKLSLPPISNVPTLPSLIADHILEKRYF